MANATWKITNATTKKNLVVINASVDSDAPQAFYYDQKTSLLPFQAGNPLAPGNADTITVPDVQKDKNGYSLPFTFIVAEAETLAPVKAISCKADLSDLQEITINDSTVKEMGKVYGFHKNITAFPASDLATGFTALDLSDDDAVKAYFDKTVDYAGVTLDALHLVRSYYHALPYGWANGKNATIYCYHAKFDTGKEDGAMKSIGTITISNDWTLPLTIAIPDRFKIVYRPNGQAAKLLVFGNGVFRDQADTAKATLALAGSFFVPSQMGVDDSDNNICTFLVGSIDGASAFGYEGAAPDGTDDDGSFWKLLDVQNVRDAVTLGTYGVSILAAIGLAIGVGFFIKWYRQRGNPAVQPERRAAQVEDFQRASSAAAQDGLRLVNEEINIPQPNEVPAAQGTFRIEQLASKGKQSVNNVRRMVANQEKVLTAIGSKMSNAALQDIVDRITDIRQRLERYDSGRDTLQDFRDRLPDTLQVLSNNASDIVVAKLRIAKRLSEADLEMYDRAMQTFDEIFNAQKTLNDEMKDIEEHADDRDIVEEEPIEV